VTTVPSARGIVPMRNIADCTNKRVNFCLAVLSPRHFQFIHKIIMTLSSSTNKVESSNYGEKSSCDEDLLKAVSTAAMAVSKWPW